MHLLSNSAPSLSQGEQQILKKILTEVQNESKILTELSELNDHNKQLMASNKILQEKIEEIHHEDQVRQASYKRLAILTINAPPANQVYANYSIGKRVFNLRQPHEIRQKIQLSSLYREWKG